MGDPLHIVEYEGPFMREDGWQHLRGGVKVREATQDEIIEAAIEAIDRQMEYLPPAESAGRSRLARQRIADWVAHQVHRESPAIAALRDTEAGGE